MGRRKVPEPALALDGLRPLAHSDLSLTFRDMPNDVLRLLHAPWARHDCEAYEDAVRALWPG